MFFLLRSPGHRAQLSHDKRRHSFDRTNRERGTMATILIVDDDEMDRVMERYMLDGTGHTLLFAAEP